MPDRPALVTAHRIGSRRLIAATCPRAAALGLHPGLSVTEAQARHPGLAIAEADPEADRHALLGLARWCLGLTPGVALTPVEDGSNDACADGLWLDASGCAPLYAPDQPAAEDRLRRTLLARLARLGIAARAAIADTPGAAHALARHGAPGQTDPLPLPVAALRLDAATCDRLDRLGLSRIGDLATLPRAPLERRFGRNRLAAGRTVLLRLDQLLGRVREPLPWLPPPGRIAARLHVFDPLVTAEGLARAIDALATDIATRLRAAGEGALGLELRLERCDNTTQTRRLGLAAPNADAAHLAKLFTTRLDELDPGEGVETLCLTVCRRARRAAHQRAVLMADTSQEAHPDPICDLIDTLSHRPGLRALWRPRLRESDVPERAFQRLPAHMPIPASPARAWLRPTRLIDPPCPVQAIAELPDAAPAQFVWQGRRHRIRCADGPERIAGEWWQRDGERRAVRDYFRVEDTDGHRFWLFRRGDGQLSETGDLRWFLHGIF